jgi:alpha-beta hydrolase superfamily lysophospholipase
MGGLIAIQLCLRRPPPVRGLVATGPWLRLRFRPPEAKVLITRLLKGVYPSLTVKTGLKVEGLSRDPEVLRAYTDDPLVHDRVSAVMGHSMLDAGGWALARASEFQIPALLMHGEEDPLTDPEATRLFYQGMGSQDKTLRIWPGLRHEIHNEPERAEVIGVMVDWLRERI